MPADAVVSRAAVLARSGGTVVETVTSEIVRRAAARHVAPLALSGFSLGFAAIAAVWLTGVTAHGDAIAFIALIFSFFTCRAARVYASRSFTESRARGPGHISDTASVIRMSLSPSTDWAQGACALLSELAVYTGLAAGATVNATASSGLSGPAGGLLGNTWLAGLGGRGPDGVWTLAVIAVVVLAVREMANLCIQAAKGRTAMVGSQDAARRILVPAPPSGIRLVMLGIGFMLAGARVTFILVIVLGTIALLLRATVPAPNSGIIGYRGDGPLSVWIGGFIDGKLPPAAPLVVGLLVTGVLSFTGLEKLSAILMFVPAEAMLLAALGCWHPHDGKRDWLVPSLIHLGEYVFLAALGFAFRVPPPFIFALLAAVVLRHFDVAYRARNQVSPGWFMRPGANIGRIPLFPGADWRGLGWEGRMIVASLAAAAGALPYAYPAAAVYLWFMLGWEAMTGWSAQQSG